MKKLLFSAFILISLTAAGQDTLKVKQCKGMTAKGQPCKSNFIPKGAEYCNTHSPDKTLCSGINAKKQPCGNRVKAKGEFCRFHKN